MDTQATLFNTENIVLVAGSVPAARTYKLQSQHVPIRGVIVDNAESTTDVWVYAGLFPNGTPYIVKAGWCRGFAIDGSSAVYVAFPGPVTAAGAVNITVSSEPQSAFSTQVVAATITGTVTAEISGTVAVAGSVTNQVSDPYPVSANPFTLTAYGALGSFGSPLQIADLNATPGQTVYLTDFVFTGLSKQADILWQFWYYNDSSVNILYGYGDANVHLSSPASLLCTVPGGMQINLSYINAPVGTLNIAAFVGGYYY